MSRRLVLTAHASLDGVVDRPEALLALDDRDADELGDVLLESRGTEVGLLLGRRTFETLRGDWSEVAWDPTGTARHLAGLERHVVSTTVDRSDWATAVLPGGEGLADDVGVLLKHGPDGDVGVHGSVTLAHALFAHGLLDEMRLVVHPHVLGHGRRLFPAGCPMRALHLADSRPLRSGVTVQVYRWR
ncbi:dihydrofolate reductase family protein [Actinomycetospora sp. CA-084318]|uniref:dihydrofolate reductase family protein n=1 Tax=Actinomycetospora sp. CA-084318 TaxID=3239892 RepID=UPI003D95AB94